MNMERLNHKELDVYIDKYLDGVLSETDTDEFETKCLEDKSFFQQVQAREQLREKVVKIIKEDGEEIFESYLKEEQALKKQVTPVSLIEKISQIWVAIKPKWRYSLIPAGAIAIFLIFFLIRSNGDFKENPDLERYLGRSISRAKPSEIEFISPAMGEKIDGKIQFSWQTELTGPYKIIVLSNKGKEVEEINTNEKTYLYENQLSPGLYYWKFSIDDKWLYTGKFIVKKK